MSLFGCAICGSSGDLFHHVCAPCVELIMAAWSGPATEDEFEAWWTLYPRKVGKDAAREKYRKARKRVSAEALVAGLRHYVASVSEKEREFIAHPATWLNQGRWQDEQVGGDYAPAVDMDELHVRTFVKGGFWATTWGPKPDDPDAPPKIRRMYEEARA